MQTCDVLIVGAGMTGASAAYEIAPFSKVILLERESQPGYHTTGRSAADFAPAYGNRVIRALTAASQAFYQEHAGGLANQDVVFKANVLSRIATVIQNEDQVYLDKLVGRTESRIEDLGRLANAYFKT